MRRWRVRKEDRERNTKRERTEDGRGRSGGGPGARVAGEGRGFESGAAFREARSALSSREPGERERTCVLNREKRVVLVCPLPRCFHSRVPFVPAKKVRSTKRRKLRKSPIDILYPFPFSLSLPLLRRTLASFFAVHLHKIWTRHSGMRRQLINASGFKSRWKIRANARD